MTKQKEHNFENRNSLSSTIKNRDKGVNRHRVLILNRAIALLIIALGIGYMLSINDLSIKGFVLNDLKSQVRDLKKENSLIETQFAQLESNNAINSRAQQLAMVKVDKIDYITLVDGKVAKK
ncbi:MAG: Cell division protein FtsL [Parcubacteria group bacterium ADurb.Bin316]|nr:MAG: Cell division protein FtsL [Parcubacteria group bacterium ADurb.Bin316]HOZ56285.1 hypothetical protein [bacterium]